MALLERADQNVHQAWSALTLNLSLREGNGEQKEAGYSVSHRI
jgi:hypothetical protein